MLARSFTPPRQFGGYEVHDLLGRGGMATVYRGEHVLLQRAVAIKFLHAGIAASSAAQQRFLREARLVAKLAHPNIVTVFDFGQLDDGTYYQASELIAGTTLREHLRTAGALPPSQALGFARQLAEGLAAAHAIGVIHRDLKPSNVMVVPDGDGHRLKILDFGIAKSFELDSEVTKTGIALGTPGYMSPEQCRGLPSGPATDIYSLGVVLYVMLCGKPPFAARGTGDLLELHANAEIPRPSALCTCSPALDALVMQCMAKAPADRPATMSDVIRAIDAALAAPVAPARAVGALDDDPGTLQLPSDPISGGDGTTTTVPRTVAASLPPRATRVVPRWAIPAAVIALGLIIGVVLAVRTGGDDAPGTTNTAEPTTASGTATPGTTTSSGSTGSGTALSGTTTSPRPTTASAPASSRPTTSSASTTSATGTTWVPTNMPGSARPTSATASGPASAAVTAKASHTTTSPGTTTSSSSSGHGKSKRGDKHPKHEAEPVQPAQPPPPDDHSFEHPVL